MNRKMLLLGCAALLSGCLISCHDKSTDNAPSPLLTTPVGFMGLWFQSSGATALLPDNYPADCNGQPPDVCTVRPRPVRIWQVNVLFRNVAFYNSAGDKVPIAGQDLSSLASKQQIMVNVIVNDIELDQPRFYSSFPLPQGTYNAIEGVIEVVSIRERVYPRSGEPVIWECVVNQANPPVVTIPRTSVSVAPRLGVAGEGFLINLPVTAWRWCDSSGGLDPDPVTFAVPTVESRTAPSRF